jgi:replication fork protection complex subunit Tof1/Swi1
VIAQKRKVVEKVDGEDVEVPSPAAISEFDVYSIPYINNDQADAASSNVWLRLLFRLAKFRLVENDEEEPEWYVPAALLPVELEKVRQTIRGYLETPYDLESRNVWDLVEKKSKRRGRGRRRRAEETESEGEEEVVERKKKKERKKLEKQQYKSAQFIEDSDEEMEGLEEFLKQEAERRAKTARKAQREGGAADETGGRSPSAVTPVTEVTEMMDLAETRKRGRGSQEKEEATGRQKRSRVVESSSESE